MAAHSSRNEDLHPPPDDSLTPLIGAHVSTAGGLHNAIVRARSIGAEVMQVFPSNPRQWRPGPYTAEELAAFGKARERARLPLFVHSIYLINLASSDFDMRRKSAVALADALRYAALAGAEAVVTHVGAHKGTGPASALGRVDATVREARELASRDAPTAAQMNLLLEGSAGAGTSLAALPPDMRALVDAVAGPVCLCLDTAHLFAAGCPLHKPSAVQSLVAELEALELLELVRLVHLNDSRSPLGSHNDRHENLWEGLIGREGLTSMIGNRAFTQIPFVLEVPGTDGHGPDRRNVRRARIMRRAAVAPRTA